MQIGSPAFEHKGKIPAAYTCEGSDTSPPLTWSEIPAEAKSLALIIDDPDAPDPKAPKRTWVHWVLFNVPPNTSGLAEDSARKGLPSGAAQARNDWGKATYGGPCPPIGSHRYMFKLYALDSELDANKIHTKAELEVAMKGHTLAMAEMYGTYEKHRNR